MKTLQSHLSRSSGWLLATITLATLPFLHGCAGVRTFPSVARAGDTVTMMAGGSERATTETVAVTLTSAATGQVWDLQALGLVRSVFNVRPDGTSVGTLYGPYFHTFWPWVVGHEPVQTVLVTDLPNDVPVGLATVEVNLNTDDSSGGGSVMALSLEVVPGTGHSDSLEYVDMLTGPTPADLPSLEAAPRAKITFGRGWSTLRLGAASLVVDFDETVVDPSDLFVYVPESTVRGTWSTTGPFGATQRMVYWHQDGQRLYLDVAAPQGLAPQYLQAYVVYPPTVTGNPALQLVSATVWDVDGNVISLPGGVTMETMP